MDEPSTPFDPMGPLADDFVARLRRGERPSISTYCRRYSELAPRIRELFPRLAMIEKLGFSDPLHPGRSRVDDNGPAPERIGEYSIIREIGRGGMGVVYEATHESLGRRVALKVLSKQFADNARSVTRFQSEARAAARLHHTNIVPVFEVGQDENYCFIAMQLIEGDDLDALIARLRHQGALGQGLRAAIPPSSALQSAATPAAESPITENDIRDASRDDITASLRLDAEFVKGTNTYAREVARIGVQVADALEHAHRRGVLHRDIKPSNILLDDSKTVWITDFGLAKTEGDANTQSGDVAGTIRYMAPERFSRQSDARTDVYGLGATLYEMLTLSPIYSAGDLVQLMQHIVRETPRPLRQANPGIPRDLETIVMKAVERDPNHRFATAGQMAEDLRRFLADLPIYSRRASLPERAWRWCARNPAISGLIMATAITLLAGISATTWKWREAEFARSAEHLSRQAADAATREVSDGLARLKSSNAMLRHGNFFAGQRRWDDADKAYERAIELRPDHVRVYEDRAYGLYAQLGLWGLANRDVAKAFELQMPANAWSWRIYALLQTQSNDRAAYERRHVALCDVFGKITLHASIPSYLRAAALIPVEGAIRSDTIALAAALHQLDVENPLFAYVCALVNCRAGQHEVAIEKCRRSLESAQSWVAKPLNYSVLAIAFEQVGRRDEARVALSQAEAALNEWTEFRYRTDLAPWVADMSAPDAWPIDRYDFLECEILVREARDRLGVESTDDPRRHALLARAFAGLRRWSEAVDEYERALALAPADPQLQLETHRSRGYAFVRHREYGASAIQFSLAKQLSLNDSDLWRFEASSRAAEGDIDRYQEVCRAMLTRFRGTTDPPVAYDVADACIRMPLPANDWPEFLEMARVGSRWYIGSIRILGAANCRAGRFADAVECFQTAGSLIPLRAADLLLLALAHHGLGNNKLAATKLAEAEQWIRDANTRGPDEFADSKPRWDDWDEPIFAMKLLAEAQATIRPASADAQ